MTSGSTDQFHTNWISRDETNYLHWTRSTPNNQIQFAFRQNWLTFDQILKEYGITEPGSALEVGCGRGSMSAYFADNAWKVTLLDYSEKAIATAKQLFLAHDLSAEFTVADCLDMPFPDESYDAIFSIGLFEHFQDVSNLIAEQARLLKPNGVLIGYVVPDYSSNSSNIQSRFNAVNKILEHLHRNGPDEPANTKSDIFRSDYSSQIYLEEMSKHSLTNLTSFGVYPLPMISHSTAFPFSLMDSYSESILVNDFNAQLSNVNTKFPWRCAEGFGQAFIVAGQKN
ncbi:class I SAM-dependent methyltransferase [Synechococcus sp. UW140]|uniref:class I SAM-dependent methyltransferase n=1 Tax=Synechococcus sp. UW140 TaxID=368503 RepID=UPI003137C40D